MRRTEACGEVEARPRHHTLGVSAREMRTIREAMRREAETQSLAGMHRMRLLRKLDSVGAIVAEGLLLFSRAVARSDLKEVGGLGEHLAHAVVLHAASEGVHGLLHGLQLGGAGPTGFMVGTALHAITGLVAERRERLAQEDVERVSGVAIGEVRRQVEHELASLHACVRALPDEHLAENERALLAQHAVYETSPEFGSPGMLDLADEMFLEERYKLPAGGCAGAVTLAVKMSISLDATLAEMRHGEDAAAREAEYEEGKTRMALVAADEGLGFSARAGQERADRRRLARARP